MILTNATPSTFTELDYGGLGVIGIDVTIDAGQANGTIVKGPGAIGGTDTLVGVNNAFNDEGLAIVGSKGDDTFNITQGTSQFSWFGIYHDGGTDQVNFTAGDGELRLRIDNDSSGVNANIAGNVISSNNGEVFNLNISNVTNSFRLSIESNNGTDTLTGSINNEQFIPGAGSDTINGGGGFDSVRYNRNGVDAVDVNLETGVATGTWDGQFFTHTLIDIDRVDGSRNDGDTLTAVNSGTEGSWLDGRGGNDTLTGGLNDDTLVGGSEDDVINGGAGVDSIVAFSGNDSIDGGAGSDLIFVDLNNVDTVSGGADYDALLISNEFGGSGSFDLSGVSVASRYDGIEELNLENGNTSDTLTLSAQNLLDFTASADSLLNTVFGNVLNIAGDFGDTLTLTQGSNYTFEGNDVDGEGRNLNVYSYSDGVNAAVIAVDEDVTVNQVA